LLASRRAGGCSTPSVDRTRAVAAITSSVIQAKSTSNLAGDRSL
jgi:hypothetical protein